MKKGAAELAAMVAMLGINVGEKRHRGQIFGAPRGNSIGPSRGPGSGRTARCRRCGAEGPVTAGPGGQRKIAGCTCD